MKTHGSLGWNDPTARRATSASVVEKQEDQPAHGSEQQPENNTTGKPAIEEMSNQPANDPENTPKANVTHFFLFR